MPPDPSAPRARPVVTRRGRGRALLPTLIVLGVLLVAFLLFTGFYTEWLWFDSVGFTTVYSKQLLTRTGLFVVFGGLLAIAVLANIIIAYRVRPPFRGLSPEQQSLDRYRVGIDPYKRAILVVLGVVLLLLGGGAASGEWRAYLLWRNGTEFGVDDPQFGMDVGFFAFDLPFLRFVLGFLFAAIILSVLGLAGRALPVRRAAAAEPGRAGDRRPPRRTCRSCSASSSCSRRSAYWLDRYGLAVKRAATGSPGSPTPTSTRCCPPRTSSTFIALLCAVLFFANVFRRTWSLPVIGFGLLVLSAHPDRRGVPGDRAAVPGAAERAGRKEAPYIQRNIEATRDAYGIVRGRPARTYAGETTTTPEELAGRRRHDQQRPPAGPGRGVADVQAAAADPRLLQLPGHPRRRPLPARRQSATRSSRSARSTSTASRNQRNWVNDHTVYTHGYGLVAAYGNTRAAGRARRSSSAWTSRERGLLATRSTSRGSTSARSPRRYSIVGAPEGTTPRELDFPDDTRPTGRPTTPTPARAASASARCSASCCSR